MIPQELRVSVALTADADKDLVFASIEEALGRRPELILYVRGAKVLSLLLRREELEPVRRIAGVRGVREERRHELPPGPKPPTARD